jgi:outer membrane receptor for ferrienterochelin and colicins
MKICILVFLLFLSEQVHAAKIVGQVKDDIETLAYATIIFDEGAQIVQSDEQGLFEISNVSLGKHTIEIRLLSYETYITEIEVLRDEEVHLNFILESSFSFINDVVITGTKTFKRKTDSPVIVSVLSSKAMNDVQACNVSEGLKFQPGLRIETDCQTCNYTQLRMNGLAGGYSQILINGRPIFSPLTGLYGLEQLPVNMIDKIEVVRGGGSSLYGSSAVGGTVNILTKIPTKNSYDVSYNQQSVNGDASDHQLNGNANLLTKNKKSGVSLFANLRNRELYDHNDDSFSELPELQNRSLGMNFFSRPTDSQKIELSISNLNEYRYGGEIGADTPHQAAQSEERNTSVWMGSVDYQINFNEDKSSFISYAAFQQTNRKHFTGIQPDDIEELAVYLENPPYGSSLVSTYNAGVQLNHELESFPLGRNVLTVGGEYIYDAVFDEIEVYNYLIDQTTKNIGAFAQSDWNISSKWNVLGGVRMDQHNFVDGFVFSPRMSVLYKPMPMSQFRLNYAKGFRAPQAFDADLHIAFAGGGISRVTLDESLTQENSHSISASWNYDKPTEDYVFGYTLEGFYTRLNNAFITESIGEDVFGEIFLKRNGAGASVQGATVELRANYKKKYQLESGFTLQTSMNDEAVVYIEGLEGIRRFIRTPNSYGFAMLSMEPLESLSVNINYVYTGSMIVPHFGGAVNQQNDEMYISEVFHDVSVRGAYTLGLPKIKTNVQLFAGVKNVFNSYQREFDIGKDRDSNFVFGPASPRTFFIGIKLFSL